MPDGGSFALRVQKVRCGGYVARVVFRRFRKRDRTTRTQRHPQFDRRRSCLDLRAKRIRASSTWQGAVTRWRRNTRTSRQGRRRYARPPEAGSVCVAVRVRPRPGSTRPRIAGPPEAGPSFERIQRNSKSQSCPMSHRLCTIHQNTSLTICVFAQILTQCLQPPKRTVSNDATHRRGNPRHRAERN